MTRLKVGIIGLGHIGRPMALRMLEKGLDLTVYDRNPPKMEMLRAEGAGVANTPCELADICEVIVVSMPSQQASVQVCLGDNGVVHGKAVRICIETSTVGSTAIHQIACGLRARGIGMIDGPVSGGPPGARAGTLAAMVSAAESDVEQARPVLDAIATNVFYLGAKPGISQVAKIINNHISAAGRLATLEGLAMGVKAGLDLKTLNDILNAGTARNFTTTHKVPAAILTKTDKVNSPLSLGIKDETLLLEEAARYGAAMWTAPRIVEFYREAAAAGYKNEDSMKVFLYVQSQSARGGAKLAPDWKE